MTNSGAPIMGASGHLPRARGFGSANLVLFDLWAFYHNFMKMHKGLGGTTPAEAAGITIRANDKWLALIQNAALL